LFEAESQRLATEQLTLKPVTIGQLVVANAQLRVEGDRWLDDDHTATRFIQYRLEPSPMGTPPFSVNTAHTRGERMWLVGSMSHLPKPNEGVRRVLRLNVTTSQEIEAASAARRSSKGLIPGVDLSKLRDR